MSCPCAPDLLPIENLPTGIPTGTGDRICLLSGDGPPSSNPPSVILIWLYRDNLTGNVFPWNPQTAAWIQINGSGEGGAGTTTRTCCNMIIAQGIPATPPPTPSEIWFQIDPIAGIIYPWNPNSAAWITITTGTGGAGSGNNNGMYWSDVDPTTAPNNPYIDNLHVNTTSGVVWWWPPNSSTWD